MMTRAMQWTTLSGICLLGLLAIYGLGDITSALALVLALSAPSALAVAGGYLAAAAEEDSGDDAKK